MTLAAIDEAKHADLEDEAIEALVRKIGRKARKASGALALAPGAAKQAALTAAAAAIRTRREALLEANAKDVAFGRAKGLSPALVDRLQLDDGRIEAMAAGLEAIAALPDPEIGRAHV